MNVIEPFIRQALAHPELPALNTGERTYTYGQLLASVRRCAARLRQAGVAPGDRVHYSLPAVPNLIVTLALAHVGAVSVALTAGRAATDWPQVHEALGIAFLLVMDRNEAPQHAQGLRGVLAVSELLAPGEGAARGAMARPAEPQEMWRIMSSSGSTGRPKFVAFSHESSLQNGLYQRLVYPQAPGDLVLIGMTPGMSFWIHACLRVLYAGACLLLPQRNAAADHLDLLYAHPVTHWVGVPSAAQNVAEILASGDARYARPPSSLRLVTIGGSVMSPQLHALLTSRLDAQVYVNYGSTEAFLIAVLDPTLREAEPQSAGRLVPWMEAQATDEEGRPLPPGQVGRLRFRIPGRQLGYLGGDAAQQAAFRDGWFQSNDVGSVTRGGVVTLAGRQEEVLNIGGVKIDPAQLEAAVAQDAAISGCVAIAVPGKLGQPALTLVVATAQGELPLEPIRARCAALGPQSVPSTVLFVPRLPYTAAGKVDRAKVSAFAQRTLASAQDPAKVVH
jgi:acyl-coenzyme A synthetase/AMP-(fatty) acid ligase